MTLNYNLTFCADDGVYEDVSGFVFISNGDFFWVDYVSVNLHRGNITPENNACFGRNIDLSAHSSFQSTTLMPSEMLRVFRAGNGISTYS